MAVLHRISIQSEVPLLIDAQLYQPFLRQDEQIRRREQYRVMLFTYTGVLIIFLFLYYFVKPL